MPNILIYTDNAATTKIAPSVLSAMMPYLEESYGNPSSIHEPGRRARTAIDTARRQVAAALGAASPKEIIFTSSGTESDNLAIAGVARHLATQGKKHIITTAIEHPAVLNCVKALEAEGFENTLLPVDPDGRVSPEAVASAIRPDTALVSVMYANNETGMIQPITEIGKICHESGIPFHSDAVQAIGSLPVNVETDNIDLLSLSAHKFRGPKGVGVLYVREGIEITPQIYGGNQESGHRSGTENTAGIVGLAAAIQLKPDTKKITKLRDKLLSNLLKIPDAHLNGSLENRLSGNISISFDNVYGESLLLMMDLYGIAASSTSACSAGTHTPSHVLLAMGKSESHAKSAIRLTLNDNNTQEEIDYMIEKMPEIVKKAKPAQP